MAAYSSILAWRIPWIEEPGKLQSIVSQRVRQTERLHFFTPLRKYKIVIKEKAAWRISWQSSG